MNLTTIEQSKKLREWDAPQKGDNLSFHVFSHSAHHYPEWFICESPYESDGERISESVAAYDLESLIEWLGHDFRLLKQFNKFESVESNRWLAEGLSFTVSGATPLEAVFALCVAIKEA